MPVKRNANKSGKKPIKKQSKKTAKKVEKRTAAIFRYKLYHARNRFREAAKETNI